MNRGGESWTAPKAPCPILAISFCRKGGRPLALACDLLVPTPQTQRRKLPQTCIPARCKHLRFDRDDPDLTQRPGAKAGSRPVFWPDAEPALYRIAVDITELRDKSMIVPHVVIEIPSLPERQFPCHPFAHFARLKRDLALKHLYGLGKHSLVCLAKQKVDMFRHDDITPNTHPEVAARLFKRKQKLFLHPHFSEQRKSVIATESEKVGLPGVMESLESVGHGKPASQ
jgi:hypothetical protein